MGQTTPSPSVPELIAKMDLGVAAHNRKLKHGHQEFNAWKRSALRFLYPNMRPGKRRKFVSVLIRRETSKWPRGLSRADWFSLYKPERDALTRDILEKMLRRKFRFSSPCADSVNVQ